MTAQSRGSVEADTLRKPVSPTPSDNDTRLVAKVDMLPYFFKRENSAFG